MDEKVILEENLRMWFDNAYEYDDWERDTFFKIQMAFQEHLDSAVDSLHRFYHDKEENNGN